MVRTNIKIFGMEGLHGFKARHTILYGFRRVLAKLDDISGTVTLLTEQA